MAIIWHNRTADGLEDGLDLDAVVSETVSGGADATEHPVEAGGSKTDHVRPRPLEVRIEALVSNARVAPETALAYDPVTRSLNTSAAELGDDRAAKARDILEAIRASGEVVSLEMGTLDRATDQSGTRHSGAGLVRSTWRLYEDMALVELTFPRDRSTGDALRFSATFRKIETVASETVDAPLITKTTRAKPRRDAGQQAAKTASAPDAEKASGKLESFARAGFRFVTGSNP